MDALRRIAYRPDVRACIRALGLANVVRNWYYRARVRKERYARFQIRGVEAVFWARTPLELRHVECSFVLEQNSFLNFLTTKLRQGDVFFDVGSNLGMFAILIAKIVGPTGRVAAFEPHNEFCQTLRENVEANGLSNVAVFQKALGDTSASAQLFVRGAACPTLVRQAVDANNSSGNSSASGDSTTSDPNPEMVDVVSGDWIRKDCNLPVPRAVKIDVEGFEYSVLLGLQQTLRDPSCEILCCEIHPSFLPPGVSAEKILDFVKSAGFNSIQTYRRLTEIHLIATKA